jgi:hypothetical protein
MKRRTFIYTGVAITVGVGLSDLFLEQRTKVEETTFLYPFILSNILDEESLRIIGSSYRIMKPDENSKVKLLNAITSRMNTIQIRTNDWQIRQRKLKRMSKMDFKSDKLIVIKGWVISETEARQCALLSLS